MLKLVALNAIAALHAHTHQVGLEHSNHKWLAVGWPQRIQQQCQDSSHLAQACRAAFGDEMGGDQDRFARAIELLDMEVRPVYSHI
jgi:hypothetical protein